MTMHDFDIKEFRQTLGVFMTGVTVVTTINEQGLPIGFTANSFTSVSLDPPLVLVCLAKTSANRDSFVRGKSYAINILADSQQDISGTFARPVENRFAGINWRVEKTGSPVIQGVTAWLDCSMYEVVDAGDHFIIIGEVMAFGNTAASPLGYLRGNYVRLSLAQQATAALEDPDQRTSVGMLVEKNEHLLLLSNQNGLHLPHAPRLGNTADSESLLGRLKLGGITTNTCYLFSVFENRITNILSIYYRTSIKDDCGITQGRFYALKDIPLEEISDEITEIMIKRYIRERETDAFGIYVGDEQKGEIESQTHNSHQADPLLEK